MYIHIGIYTYIYGRTIHDSLHGEKEYFFACIHGFLGSKAKQLMADVVQTIKYLKVRLLN
jgi:hypothetical protein